ncbi:MAG: hypothetical protein AB7O24_05705 [Kofleriaceae bacterium]
MTWAQPSQLAQHYEYQYKVERSHALLKIVATTVLVLTLLAIRYAYRRAAAEERYEMEMRRRGYEYTEPMYR